MKLIFLPSIFCILFFSCSSSQKESKIDLSKVNHITESRLSYKTKSLKEKEKIEIHYWILGCDMREPLERSLYIKKVEGHYQLNFCELIKEIDEYELIPILRDFQVNLKNMNSSDFYSTTTEKLKIVSGTETYLGFDQSQWNGFYHLIDKLFQVAYFEQKDAICT